MHINTYAVYCRISADRRGTELGVQRQEEACRALAERDGLHISSVLIDNDFSAYSGKRRPRYEQLLELMRSGTINGVIALHSDRLHRSPVELENFITICDMNKIDVKTVQAGAIDLSTASGRMGARIYGAVARHEVEHTIERQKAAKLQAAKSGLPSGGNRAYGYEQNGMMIVEHEAAIVREIIDRFIAGDSWRSIAVALNQRGIPTAKGYRWSSINVHNVAIRKRNISIRVHNDDEYAAQWPPLINMDTWEDLQLAMKRGQALHGSRTYTRKHLLKGFVFCGKCGNRMNITSSTARDGSYLPAFSCRKYDDRRGEVGCGGVKRRQAPVEELVIDCVMYRLDTPEIGKLLDGSKSSTPKLKELMRKHSTQQQRLTEILELYSAGEMDFGEYKSAKASAQARLEALGRELDRESGKATVANVPVGQTLRDAWDKADLMWRRQLLDAIIDKIYIDPRIPGKGMKKWRTYQFDPNLIRITWKV